jgi:ABC-2 type transport system ATP-binding protein
MSHALEIRGLRTSFRAFELGPLDLTVPRGAIYGFVGPNGAGKTTTIDLIFGMGIRQGGSISVLGLDHLRDEVAMKARVGYVSPDLDYRPWRTVGRAIRFVRGFYPDWDAAYCERLLAAFHLSPDQSIRTLSFGARIALSLVLALSWRPALLVLDEPTVGLDAIARQRVFAELLAAVREGDRTVFISSHAITDLERFADHVGMIKDGRILFEGAIDDVLERWRMVDAVADTEPPREAALANHPGVRIQSQHGGRLRMLVDRRLAPLEWLRQQGLTPIADTPVSLEELFVALGQD